MRQILVGANWASYDGKNTKDMFTGCGVQAVTPKV